jgi:hypothetical protein
MVKVKPDDEQAHGRGLIVPQAITFAVTDKFGG